MCSKALIVLSSCTGSKYFVGEFLQSSVCTAHHAPVKRASTSVAARLSHRGPPTLRLVSRFSCSSSRTLPAAPALNEPFGQISDSSCKLGQHATSRCRFHDAAPGFEAALCPAPDSLQRSRQIHHLTAQSAGVAAAAAAVPVETCAALLQQGCCSRAAAALSGLLAVSSEKLAADAFCFNCGAPGAASAAGFQGSPAYTPYSGQTFLHLPSSPSAAAVCLP